VFSVPAAEGGGEVNVEIELDEEEYLLLLEVLGMASGVVGAESDTELMGRIVRLTNKVGSASLNFRPYEMGPE
jgi:hypothetical protein